MGKPFQKKKYEKDFFHPKISSETKFDLAVQRNLLYLACLGKQLSVSWEINIVSKLCRWLKSS